MGIRFEIEYCGKEGRGKHTKYYVFAKCLEMDKDFILEGNPKLGGVEINNWFTQPRAVDKDGNLRLDLFAFKIHYKKEGGILKEGDIVELTGYQNI